MPADVPNSISGRRGYWRYLYGTHGWIPTVESDLTLGMRRDFARTNIPHGGVYDSADFLLHEPGVAIKRGGTSYAGPVLPSAGAPVMTVVYADFPSGPQVLTQALVGGTTDHLFKVTAGTSTDIGATGVQYGSYTGPPDPPKLRIGGSKNLVIFTSGDGITAPRAYDGASLAALGGSPPAGKFTAIYKTRLALANTSANPNRIYFSQTPDIESTWDTSNSWIDADHAVTGLAALHNSLLVFSAGATERILGSTPPPGSDMDRAPVGSIGCTDARSIVVQEGNALFCNPRGVYLTNGAGFASLTTEGGIESYWQSLFSGYDSATWTIAAGIYRSFFVVTIQNNVGANVQTLMCNVPRRAWWRLQNIGGRGYSSAFGSQEELYYADPGVPRVTKLAGIFTPTSANKNDADGTAVAPVLEWRAFGDGSGVKSYGFGRLSYYMADAASDNPSLAVTVKTGVRAAVSSTPAESPLLEDTDTGRGRFSICKETQAVTVKVAQTNASSATEIYALEVEERSQPLGHEGVGNP